MDPLARAGHSRELGQRSVPQHTVEHQPRGEEVASVMVTCDNSGSFPFLQTVTGLVHPLRPGTRIPTL